MTETFYVIQTILGIGLLIFLHELGHFFAARWAGVRVDAFSLGFGPVLWSKQKGATEYRLSLVPIGGYVKLAGETPSELKTGASDELASKSIGTRAFIFSAGVLMNLLIALVLFPLLFFIGVPFVEPRIGSVTPGEAAWRAGVEPGARIISIEGKAVFGFEDLFHDYVLSGKDGIRVLLEMPQGGQQELFLRPDPNRIGTPQSLGVSPSLNPELRVEVASDSPASRAGLQSGDRILKWNGKALTSLDLSLVQESFSSSRPIDLEIQRDGSSKQLRIVPEPITEGRKQIGVHPPVRRVTGIRGNGPVQILALEWGDLILRVNAKEILAQGDLAAALQTGKENVFQVQRKGESLTRSIFLAEEAQRIALISNLSLANDVDAAEIVPVPGMPAMQAGIQAGDRVIQLGTASVRNFRSLVEALQSQKGPELSVTIQRGAGNETKILDLLVRPVPPMDFGFQFAQNLYTYRSSGPIGALVDGWRCSWGMVEELYLSVKKMLTRELDAQNVLGGIIGIGGTAINISSQYGFVKFLYFLALLSMNLAILNVLPIPILDGGHLFFLLIEKIKGSPVSDRVLGYSQIVGLALLLGLMIYATYNDIQRFF